MSGCRFRAGDQVVYRKQKHSSVPSPRAHHVEPEPHGDGYSYLVDKYWVVLDTGTNGKLIVATRRHKRHEIDACDPNLRLAHWWERLLYRSRFPRTEPVVDSGSATPPPMGSMPRSA